MTILVDVLMCISVAEVREEKAVVPQMRIAGNSVEELSNCERRGINRARLGFVGVRRHHARQQRQQF
jgi:hypothetical protein